MEAQRTSRFLRLVCLAPLTLAGLAWDAAADWRLTPRFSVQQNYTDNVDLAPRGEERSDWVTELRPGVSIVGQQSRVNFLLDYALQGLRYRHESDENDVNHQLQASLSSELVRQMVFLDASASASQENRDNRGRIATSNISVSDNTRQVYTYSVTPSFKHHFGPWADTVVTYNVNRVINEGGEDSDSNGVSAVLSSGREFSRVPWSINYSSSTITDNDGGQDRTFENLVGEVRYIFDRKLSAFVNVGIDNNDYQANDDTDGARWRFGATWTPSSRTSLTAGYGKRYFNENFDFSLNHRRRRSVWSASYGEDVTTSRDLQLERRLFVVVDDFGEPIPDPFTGEIVPIPVDLVRETEEVLVNKRFNASFALKGRRSDFGLNAYSSRRSSEVSGEEERVVGFSASLGRNLSPRANASVNASWQETKDDESDDPDQFWSLGMRYRHEISRSLSATVSLDHVRNDPEDSQSRYEENRIAATLTVRI